MAFPHIKQSIWDCIIISLPYFSLFKILFFIVPTENEGGRGWDIEHRSKTHFLHLQHATCWIMPVQRIIHSSQNSLRRTCYIGPSKEIMTASKHVSGRRDSMFCALLIKDIKLRRQLSFLVRWITRHHTPHIPPPGKTSKATLACAHPCWHYVHLSCGRSKQNHHWWIQLTILT